MGKMQRTKGATFERWLVRQFNQHLVGPRWKRGLQSRGGGKEVPDLDGPCFHIEAKHHIRPNIIAALEQARDDSKGSTKMPAAVTKGNRMEPICSMYLTDWLDLAAAYLQREVNNGNLLQADEGVSSSRGEEV